LFFMPNTLKHEDIFFGMRFRYDEKSLKIVHINDHEDNQNVQYLLVDGPNVFDYFSLEELNKLEFLGIQTEPVQLGEVESIFDRLGYHTKGNLYPYYGNGKGEARHSLVGHDRGYIAQSPIDRFNLINAPKPEIPEEITMHGVQWVPKGDA